jgi:ubiquinone/menaquinone biosynthesis C-methylase UbiE
MAAGGAAMTASGILAYAVLHSTRPELAFNVLLGCLFPGLSWLLSTVCMVRGSRVAKLRLRDRLLASLPWRGDERVLDAGCGHGLFLLGAAKHLCSGRVIGIDLWSARDQAANHPEATWRNAELEDVTGLVELATGDVRRLPFADESFDVVLSSWVLHNIRTAEGREQAVRETARVLKPGGRVVILDIGHTQAYARVLDKAGLQKIRRRLVSLAFLIPTFLVEGHKPHSA